MGDFMQQARFQVCLQALKTLMSPSQTKNKNEIIKSHYVQPVSPRSTTMLYPLRRLE